MQCVPFNKQMKYRALLSPRIKNLVKLHKFESRSKPSDTQSNLMVAKGQVKKKRDILMGKTPDTHQTAIVRHGLTKNVREKLIKTKLYCRTNMNNVFSPTAITCPFGLRDPPSWAWQECNRLLRMGRPWGAVTLSRWCEWWYGRM